MKQHHTRAKPLNQKCAGSSRNHHLLNDVVHLVAEKFKGAVIPAGVPVSMLTLLSALTASPAHALPQNGAVAGGAATISQPNPTTMTINQTSGNAIINWHGYNIGANESVRYSQPGSSSIMLNRVTGGDPSYIYGLLSGNGQVWVINPNGLLVGPGATIQTGSFLASTMNITNENFLSGKHIFTSAPDSLASVVNQGSISAAQGGYVVLAAPSVTNSGSIVANVGSVHLAAGDTVTLSLDNGNLINVAVNGDVAANALGVTNTGRITANGGQVVLSARVAGDVMKSVVNNEGIIEAQSTIEHNGAIILDNGDGGITANSGTLDASGNNPGETGGNITVLGDKVGLFAGSSIDVSGDAGGGTVLIGGNFHGAGAEKNASMTYVDKDAAIQADARAAGDGGRVAVWADDATKFYGTISAKGGVQGGDGGFVEVSGKHSLTYAGLVNLGASKGATGTLLLDPDDITISHGSTDTNISVAGTDPFTDTSSGSGSVLTDGTLNTQLGTASVSVATTTGSITSLADVDITLNSNTLTLQSAADVNLAGTYRGTGALNLTFASTLDLTTAPTFVGAPVVAATGGGSASIIKATGQTWALSGNNQGSVAGVTFTNAGTLTDTGTGIFNMGSGGSLTGNLDGGTGGTLNYSSYTTPVTLDLAGNNTTGIVGSWSGITTVTGNAATSNTVTGSSKTYTLTGANAGNSSGVSWSSFGTISDSGTGTLSTAGTQVYNLTGLNMGDVTTLLPGGFTGIGTLSSTGAATFNMGTNGSVSGNLNGGTGGSLNYSSYITPVTLDLAGTGTTGIGGSWSNIATVTGTSSIGDTIRGLGKTYTLDSSIADKGSSSGVTWSAFENIADTGAGTFKFGAAGSVTGNITAVGGTLDYTGHATAAHVTLSGNAGTTTGIGGTWSGITSVTGSANTGDLITGASQTYTLDNTLANKGSNGVVTWTGIENLTDAGTGTFNMGSGGRVSGNLDGGANGTLDYSNYTAPVTLNLAATTGTTGIGGAWSHISTVTGNANSNTVVGSNKTYVLDNSIANKGSNGGVTWTGFKNISDTGTGVFSMGNGGSVTGNLDGGLGGTLNYSTYTNPVTLNLAGTATGIGGSWSNIATVTGSSNNDTVSGMGKTYNLTAANAGSSGGVSWTSFEKIADSGTGTIATSGGRTYTLTGANTGTVATLLPGGYTGIGTLADSGAGVFRFAAGGAVTGTISATNGTLDYSAGITGPVAVDLTAQTGTGIGGTWNGITTVTGSGAADTMGGTNATYNLTAANAGTSNGASWSSFEKIADSGTGTIATSGGRTYTLTGANTGTVATLLPGGYTGIGTLTDSGAGLFRFAAGGAVTGTISAANGTLDYSAGITGPVAVDLTAQTGTGIGGTWNGITTVSGSGSADTMGGTNATYSLTAANAGSSNGVSWTSFENLHDTAAGTFRLGATGAVAGDIVAANGTLDYSAGITGPVTVDLTAQTGTGIGGTWHGITTVTGSGGSSDSLTGSNQTYNLTGVDAGNNGSVRWTSFENIAGTGSNSYSGAVGSTLSGAISNTADAVTLQGAIQTGGGQSYLGPVKLAAATTLTSTGSGAITFAHTVDSDTTPRDLTVGTSGVTTFDGAVGATPLNSLTVKPGGTTYINGGSVSTSGAAGQTYNNAVVLGGGTILNAGPGAITEGDSGSLTTTGLLTTRSGSGQDLVGNGANSVAAFNATNTSSGDITLTNRSPLLTITGIKQSGGGLSITNSGAITSSGPLTVSGATTITAASQSVTLTDAANDFSGPVTVAAAATDINDRNDLTVVLNTTGPTTLTAGADMTLSGTSTDSVSATAVDNVTLSNPAASILHITGATIDGAMDNSTPLDLTTTSRQTPINVSLTGSIPFLTYAGDIKTNIQSLGTYNGAVIMGTELDHYKATIDVKAATTALIVATERMGVLGMLVRFDEYFTATPMESIIDDTGAFNPPEAEPTLIDR